MSDAIWLQLARRLPEPYNAAPLLLYAWWAWRRRDGALASIAADLALHADPCYPAAQQLRDLLTAGIDPRTLPLLRMTDHD